MENNISESNKTVWYRLLKVIFIFIFIIVAFFIAFWVYGAIDPYQADDQVIESDETNENTESTATGEETSGGTLDLIIENMYFIREDGSTIGADDNGHFSAERDSFRDIKSIDITLKNIGSRTLTANDVNAETYGNFKSIKLRASIGESFEGTFDVLFRRDESLSAGSSKISHFRTFYNGHSLAVLNGPYPTKITLEINPSDGDYANVMVNESDGSNNTKTFWATLTD